MCKIQTEITIQAPIEKTWEVLTDFKNYPQWNPFLTRFEEIDSTHFIIEMTSNGKPMTFKPTLIKKEAPHELRWIGRLAGIRGLFTGEHYFKLSQTDSGTHLTHGENFSGILALFSWPFVKKDIQANFEKMNEALRATLEA